MTNLDRFGVFDRELAPDLWRTVESLSGKADVEEVVDYLSVAVSHGLFGVASELSEQVRVRAGDILSESSELRIRLEMEYLKRLHYLGFVEPVIDAADRVLHLCDGHGDEVPGQSLRLWRFTALGYKAWVVEDPDVVRGIVEACDNIVRSSRGGALRDIFIGFLSGIKGKVEALEGHTNEFHTLFKEGISVLESLDRDTSRSELHLKVRYCEQCADIADWEQVAKHAKSALEEVGYLTLKSHLTLRILLLLLRCPETFLSGKQQAHVRFRFWCLMHAKGLSPQTTVYPLLAEASEWLDGHGWSLHEIDLRASVRDWLLKLNGQAMEQVVLHFYRMNYQRANRLPRDFPAFDLAAVDGADAVAGPATVAVQVKHHANPIYKKDIPSTALMSDSAARFASLGYASPSRFHWIASHGVHERALRDLQKNIEAEFGTAATLTVIDLDEFVDHLTSDSTWLFHLLNAEVEIGYPGFSD